MEIGIGHPGEAAPDVASSIGILYIGLLLPGWQAYEPRGWSPPPDTWRLSAHSTCLDRAGIALLTLTIHALTSILGNHAEWTHFVVSQAAEQHCLSFHEHDDMDADDSRA